MTNVGVYLPYALTLPVGDEPVRLYGLIGLRGGEAVFALTSALAADGVIDEALVKRLSPPDATQSIDAPLGLTGVRLDRLELGGTIGRDATGAARLDMAVQAKAAFPGLPRPLALSALMVVDGNRVRLVRVALELEAPLTLSDILGPILPGFAAWAEPVTRQFAFTGGELYWLEKRDGAGSDQNYNYPAGSETLYQPGYHIRGNFRLFGKYDFSAGLGLPQPGSLEVEAEVDKLDAFDFIKLETVVLRMAQSQSSDHIGLSIDAISILDTKLGGVIATYDTGTQAFTGKVTAKLDDVTLTIHLAWDEGGEGKGHGLRITGIDGLPHLPQPLDVDQLGTLKRVLDTGKGDCGALLNGWFKGLKVTLTPSLNGSPAMRGEAPHRSMVVPVKLDYELKLGDTRLPLPGAAVESTLRFPVPATLAKLPVAILEGVFANLAQVLKDMLSDPKTYAALAIAIGTKVGAQAFARFICRALEQGLKELVKAIAEVAAKAAKLLTDSLAAIAELTAVLVKVAVLSIVAVIGDLADLLKELWNEIKELFGGDDADEKREDKVREALGPIREDVEGLVKMVNGKVTEMKGLLEIGHLETFLDPALGVCADVEFTAGPQILGEGANLERRVAFLFGEPGQAGELACEPVSSAGFPASAPLSAFLGKDYRMNASAQLAVTGLKFLDPTTRASLESHAGELARFDSAAADELLAELRYAIKTFETLNETGVIGNVAYAASRVPSVMTVGESLLGFNSRVAA